MTGFFALLILPVTILISPIVLSLASKQESKVKQKLRYVFQISLAIIIALALLNWETQGAGGRNAYSLALDFKSVFLWLFIAVTFVQLALLQLKNYKYDLLAAIANIFATFLFFASAISISNTIGQSLVSPAIITVAMTTLINNVLGLVLINKDPTLLAKFPWSQEAVDYAKTHNIKQTKFQKIATWVLFSAVVVFMAVMLFSYFSKNKVETTNQTSQIPQTSVEEDISPDEAGAKVRELAEVKDYLKRVPNAKIDVESADEEKNTYLIHVYEIKNGHTATFNWYNVDKKTGEITAEFDFEEGSE